LGQVWARMSQSQAVLVMDRTAVEATGRQLNYGPSLLRGGLRASQAVSVP
jgi:hypothetical protein